MQLWIGIYLNYWLLVIWNNDNLFLWCILSRSRQILEELQYLLLDKIHIHISHHNDSLIVGTIPIMIEPCQYLGLERVQIVQIANDIAMFILCAAPQSPNQLHRRSPPCTIARSQLLLDHTALLIYLLHLRLDEARPIVQYQKCAINDGIPLQGYILHHIDRLIPTGRSVQISPKLNTYTLQILDQHLIGQIARPIESHMLHEVRQTLLVIILLNSPHIREDIEVRLPCWLGIVSNVIVQRVGQNTTAQSPIIGN